MQNLIEARKVLITRILEGSANASRTQRRATFENAGLEERLKTLIEKVAERAIEVTDEDVAAARAAGLSGDQIFETIIRGAVGQATNNCCVFRQLRPARKRTQGLSDREPQELFTGYDVFF